MDAEAIYWKLAYYDLSSRIDKYFKDVEAHEATQQKAFEDWNKDHGLAILMKGAVMRPEGTGGA